MNAMVHHGCSVLQIRQMVVPHVSTGRLHSERMVGTDRIGMVWLKFPTLIKFRGLRQ